MEEEKEYSNLLEIDDEIAKLEANVPDKRTKEYSDWREKINRLFSLYNKMANFKCFKLIK